MHMVTLQTVGDYLKLVFSGYGMLNAYHHNDSWWCK